jgi:hypothetical protein
LIVTVSAEARRRAHLGYRPVREDIVPISLAESSSVVVLMYRDEMWSDDVVERGLVELAIVQNQWGPIGTVSAAWVPEFGLCEPRSRATGIASCWSATSRLPCSRFAACPFRSCVDRRCRVGDGPTVSRPLCDAVSAGES